MRTGRKLREATRA